MGLSGDQFTNTNPNFANVRFEVTDGYQRILPAEAVVEITGHTGSSVYDGKTHTTTGYDVKITGSLYSEDDFTFGGTAEAARTNVTESPAADGTPDAAADAAAGEGAGRTWMNLTPDQFTNHNTNFGKVEFIVNDGWQEITPATAHVLINGHQLVQAYDGEEHSVSGYDVVPDHPLYSEEDIVFTADSGREGIPFSDAAAARTEAGTTEMGLTAGQFANANTNFTDVVFEVTDGFVTVTPVSAVVTITGHTGAAVYDGSEHQVSGYDFVSDHPLYTENDFVFNGTGLAAGTDAGSYRMNLSADQFENVNPSFGEVTFVVTDGTLEIAPREVHLTSESAQKAYDGTPLTAPGVTGTEGFVEGEASARAEGSVLTVTDGEAVNRIAVTPQEGFRAANYLITKEEGTLKITENTEEILVKISGCRETAMYDGAEHTVSGYDVAIENGLYSAADFTFSGNASAARTHVEEEGSPAQELEDGSTGGRTWMGLAADQFTNVNPNFTNVVFEVSDGCQTITPASAVVEITGHSSVNAYDGTRHTVEGYDVSIGSPLYAETDFSFAGTASASRTYVYEDAEGNELPDGGSEAGETFGRTWMGLAAEQFTNSNPDFAGVQFVVTDGYQGITPEEEVVVTIRGTRQENTYDGTAHTAQGYTFETTSPLYTENDFAFAGTAEAMRTHVVEDADVTDGSAGTGTTWMGLAAEQFTNTSPNFTNVTFVVEDGYQRIMPKTVTLTSQSAEKEYDGTPLTSPEVTGGEGFAEGEIAELSAKGSALNVMDGEQVNRIEYTGTENFHETDYVIAKQEGTLRVTPVTREIVVSIAGHTSEDVVYDGQEHSVEGYDVLTTDGLYGEEDFNFS